MRTALPRRAADASDEEHGEPDEQSDRGPPGIGQAGDEGGTDRDLEDGDDSDGP